MSGSNLGQAMLGDASMYNGMIPRDPAYLPAAQRMGLARALIGEGTSAAPAYPMQALARLAQALVGGYEMNQGQKEFTDLNAQQLAASRDAMAPLNALVFGGGGAQGGGGGQAAPQAMPQSGGAPLPTAVHQLESGGSMQPGITGDGGAAAGPMQVHQGALDDVNRAHGTNYTLDQLTANPQLGKAVGDAYLSIQQARYPGRPDLALAAYNAGPGATDKAVASGQGVAALPPSAQQYVAHGMQLAGGQAAPGSTQVAQAGNVAMDAAPQGPQQTAQAGPQPGAAPPGLPGQQQPQAGVPGAGPQTGLNAPNVQRGLQIMQQGLQSLNALNPYSPTYAADAAKIHAAIEYGQQLMKFDTVTVDPNTGVQTSRLTGQQSSAAQPLPHYQETSPGSGIYTDASGTHPPTFQPPGRGYNIPGIGFGHLGPGGQFILDQPQNLPGIGAQKSTEAQATKTGEQTALTAPQMERLGTDSRMQIATIDTALGQLRDARQAGIPTGYFAPWLAQGTAMAKSLGVDVSGANLDPSAVSDIQAARKSLAIVGGGIIRNILGPGAEITEGKLQQFIHATPGIETDPMAIDKILGWARSQAVYGENMAMDAMKNTHPDTGMIPLGWKAQYYAKNGFGPIYNPTTGELAQPAGTPSGGEPPKAAAPPAQSQKTPQYSEGQTATGPGGKKMVFRGGQWTPQ